MIKNTGLLIAVLLLAGCATTDKPIWANTKISTDDNYTQLS